MKEQREILLNSTNSQDYIDRTIHYARKEIVAGITLGASLAFLRFITYQNDFFDSTGRYLGIGKLFEQGITTFKIASTFLAGGLVISGAAELAGATAAKLIRDSLPNVPKL